MVSEFITVTNDGSKTLYSPKYHQHYHSVKDGAILETLHKHILPAFEHHQGKKSLKILDICFGLGYNSFLTILHNQTLKNPKKLEIHSPELDSQLIQSLGDFEYPESFEPIRHIIKAVSKNLEYCDELIKINIYNENARHTIKNLREIDIVYQDAFSSDTNKELWSVEYFSDIAQAMNSNAILTTYSIATPVRLAMNQNELFIYEHKNLITKKGTLAFLTQQNREGFVDMNLKLSKNPNAKAIFD